MIDEDGPATAGEGFVAAVTIPGRGPMPIFEYICKDCRKRFEALVYGGQQPKCPLCQSANLDQQISTFAVGAAKSAAAAAGASPCASGCAMAGSCPKFH